MVVMLEGESHLLSLHQACDRLAGPAFEDQSLFGGTSVFALMKEPECSAGPVISCLLQLGSSHTHTHTPCKNTTRVRTCIYAYTCRYVYACTHNKQGHVDWLGGLAQPASVCPFRFGFMDTDWSWLQSSPQRPHSLSGVVTLVQAMRAGREHALTLTKKLAVNRYIDLPFGASLPGEGGKYCFKVKHYFEGGDTAIFYIHSSGTVLFRHIFKAEHKYRYHMKVEIASYP